ncbi:MAG TPA: cytochrome c oxidase assembly protein [Candidatus Cybelea sp.]|nr:cytochrome c oxidase assembly protein [Candidatus Cybelea sp.]
MSAPLRSTFFIAAAATVAVAALAPPLDRLADVSFAWHMLQHLVLFYLVTLLVLVARPFDLLRHFGGKRATAAVARASRPLHALASPVIALTVFVAILWTTHVSPLYELALERPAVHVAEHGLYVIAGLFFWLPVLTVPPLRPQSYPARLLYLVVALPQCALLGMVIASARRPLYPHYVAASGSLQAALTDQGNAAALMWILGGAVVFTALLVTLGRWAQREREPRVTHVAI